MVRVNLIKPKYLADQHLIAEYAEILMLVEYIKRYPIVKKMPPRFTLNEGHQIFFKNKLLYLKKRHELLIEEMKKRGFHPKIKLKINDLPKNLKKDYRPNNQDKKVIKKRLKFKINLKPKFYRYYGESKPKNFFLKLIDEAK